MAQKPRRKDPSRTAADEADELIEGTPEQRDEAGQRAAECNEQINLLLAKFNCRIVPFINPPENVGPLGNKIQLTASYGVAPLPPQ